MGCGASTPAETVNEVSKGVTGSAAKSTDQKGVEVLGKGFAEVAGDYHLGKVLGRGQFGTTRLAENKKERKTYACKSIAKRKLTCAEDIEDVQREVQIMHHLKGHPNITYLRDTYEDKQHVHLVMDLCAGGELFDAIVKRGSYSEKDAATLIRTIVSVVAHCHSMNVMHRDLKPENFLLESDKADARILCTDFGLSVFYKPGQQFSDVVGSAYYVAPEVLGRRYGPEADIWSCGVILYILLSGVPPFWGETETQIFDSIRTGEIDFKSDPWPHISDAAKDCVARMLERNPAKRAKADEILKHPWMKEHGVASDKPLGNIILSRLHNFAGMNKLKKEAMKIIASGMPADEIEGLRQIFVAIDTDKSGTITAQELHEALTKKGTSLNPEDVENLLKLVDVDANGTIEYEEFLAATMSQQQLESEENLRAAFAHFDTNGDGMISKEELREALAKNMALTEEELEKILKDVDVDGNGEIDYDEFCSLILSTSSNAVQQVQKVVTKTRGELNAYKAAQSVVVGGAV